MQARDRIYRVYKWARWVLARRPLYDAGLDGSDASTTVFLAGSGRSGTTWIAHLLNHTGAYRLMFEPFHAAHVALARPFGEMRYLRADESDATFVEPARRVISGAVRDVWIDGLNHRRVARLRIIKEIKAQLFLPWLQRLFPGMPMLFVLRHPCAVASSRRRLGWEPVHARFKEQEPLMADHLAPFADLLEGAATPFEQHVVDWCVENLVPLRELAASSVHVALYEDLCTEPERELGRFFRFLGQDYEAGEMAELLWKPSPLARRWSAVVTGKGMTDAWLEDVSQGEVDASLSILERFGLDRIYGADPLPRIGADEVLSSQPEAR